MQYQPARTQLPVAKQQGAALIVSLMILLIMAIIGVSALSNTGLEEKMSKNFQSSTIAFQAAESAIQQVVIQGDAGGTGQYDNPFYVAADDPLLMALDAGLDDASTVVSHDLDPNAYIVNTQLNANSTVIYKSDGYCPGTSTDVSICYYFEVSAAVEIENTGTTATHVQGVGRPSPNTNAS